MGYMYFIVFMVFLLGCVFFVIFQRIRCLFYFQLKPLSLRRSTVQAKSAVFCILGVLCVQPCVAYGCHYGCFLSCMFEDLGWLLELLCFLPPEACPTCWLLVWVTLKVVYASVLSVVFGFYFGFNRVC